MFSTTQETQMKVLLILLVSKKGKPDKKREDQQRVAMDGNHSSGKRKNLTSIGAWSSRKWNLPQMSLRMAKFLLLIESSNLKKINKTFSVFVYY